MSDSNALSFALGFLASAYENQDCGNIVASAVKIASAKAVKGTALPNVQGEDKVKAEKKSRTKAAPARVMATTVVAKVLPILTAGTYDAATFLRMLRANPPKGSSASPRDMTIQALQGFTGYDPGMPLGPQEFAARTKAINMIRPIDTSGPSRAELRSASLSVKGFVAGLPSGTARLTANLLGRQRMLTEQVSKMEALIVNPSMTNEEKLVETGRIMAGPADMDKDGKEIPRSFRPMDPHATLASIRKALSALNDTLDLAE